MSYIGTLQGLSVAVPLSTASVLQARAPVSTGQGVCALGEDRDQALASPRAAISTLVARLYLKSVYSQNFGSTIFLIMLGLLIKFPEAKYSPYVKGPLL